MTILNAGSTKDLNIKGLLIITVLEVVSDQTKNCVKTKKKV
jgi:hypothetical protein